MEVEDKTNLGTVYYPLSLAVLVAVFWRGGYPLVVMIGAMAMALGDAFASIIGKAWGRHNYRVWFREKSWEGSLAMFFFSLAGVVLVLWLMTDLSLTDMLIRGAVISLMTAVVEGLSPMGLDNLTVPLCAGFGYYLMFV